MLTSSLPAIAEQAYVIIIYRAIQKDQLKYYYKNPTL